uniref:Uncharacterized protein n=1 Tax=Pluralibacter gergoviae TaxID=61647 RepID=A0A142I510_PLUGE|nr:hypothetical protein LG71_28760 [Pluralibacter gergoviae]
MQLLSKILNRPAITRVSLQLFQYTIQFFRNTIRQVGFMGLNMKDLIKCNLSHSKVLIRFGYANITQSKIIQNGM